MMQIAAITTAIAGLTVAGVTIQDYDTIPEQADNRAPTIIPRPDGFVSDLSVVRQTVGASGFKIATYTLAYRLLYAPVGVGRAGVFDVYAGMVNAAFAFLDAVIALDQVSTTLHMQPRGVAEFGPVSDPAGNIFHGCDLLIDVEDWINA